KFAWQSGRESSDLDGSSGGRPAEPEVPVAVPLRSHVDGNSFEWAPAIVQALEHECIFIEVGRKDQDSTFAIPWQRANLMLRRQPARLPSDQPVGAVGGDIVEQDDAIVI
ncbi:MAG: hypothetical protein IT456_09320, partial [Planctomycetes bacterium]|nr:hypothetical protein [Planctomycetota bacterium]